VERLKTEAVLDVGSDSVEFAMFAQECAQCAKDSEVVCLGAAGGKNNFVFVCTEDTSNILACRLKLTFCC
jgi:hypothetical protein